MLPGWVDIFWLRFEWERQLSKANVYQLVWSDLWYLFHWNESVWISLNQFPPVGFCLGVRTTRLERPLSMAFSRLIRLSSSTPRETRNGHSSSFPQGNNQRERLFHWDMHSWNYLWSLSLYNFPGSCPHQHRRKLHRHRRRLLHVSRTVVSTTHKNVAY